MDTGRRVKNKSKHPIAALVTGKKSPCGFCQCDEDDEIAYGRLYSIGDIQCHYYCVLLSSRGLMQKGKDEDGLLGFLYADILAEIKRSKKQKCSYCLKGGANLRCSVGQCRKKFHLPCGRERNAMSLFYGSYKTFCQLHAPRQNIPKHIMAPAKLRKQSKKDYQKPAKTSDRSSESENQAKKESEAVCAICYEELDAFPTPHTFWPPCCARDAWLHRTCLQRMALSSGMHHLKCPLCNEKKKFYNALLTQGYYVPNRDASWEWGQDAFAEFYVQERSCAAVRCLCPMGRGHDADTGYWDIQLCLLCGAVGMHKRCLKGAGGAPFVCATCGPAAPDLMQNLAARVEALSLSEQAQGARSGRGRPRSLVMPSHRMVLRRRTRGIQLQDNTENSAAGPLQDIDKDYLQPTVNPEETRSPSALNMLEQGLKEQIRKTGVKESELDINNILKRFSNNLQKPRPLSEKKKIITKIIEGVFENMPKSHSSKKCGEMDTENVKDMQVSVEENKERTEDRHRFSKRNVLKRKLEHNDAAEKRQKIVQKFKNLKIH